MNHFRHLVIRRKAPNWARYSSSKDAVTANLFFDKILTVQTTSEARRIVDKMASVRSVLGSDGRKSSRVWACDTEVADIDLSEVGPVGNGKVVSISIYGGPDVDFGGGKSILWVDNAGAAEGTLSEFKPFFEDSTQDKVWHNYGFDRHVMFNEGIDCHGFRGDTMHMARLWSTNRDKSEGGNGYSLESLSTALVTDPSLTKTSMKDLFGVAKKKKNGDDGKIRDIPPVRELQTNPETRQAWIEYSAKDAAATWHVYHALRKRLQLMPWIVSGEKLGSMADFYDKYLREFGKVLTDMERNGITVDTVGHLRLAEARAREERSRMESIFLQWARKYCLDCQYLNIASTAQLQQLFFGGYENRTLVERVKVFEISKSEVEYAEDEKTALTINPYINSTVGDLKKLLVDRSLPTSGKKSDLMLRLLTDDHLEHIEMQHGEEFARSVEGEAEASLRAKQALDRVASRTSKTRSLSIETIGLDPVEFTPLGAPQVTAAVLKKLAGKDLFGDEKDCVWGTAFAFFGGGDAGKEACRAIAALANVGQIDATITNFLVPLQALVDGKSRIHCSLNLNTETGRLSSRRPNLQNQPALEKDQYKIRDAFIAEPGNTLIVADYGQLELRVLAHITNCKSMIAAFESGGCFHSRTALGMYQHIKDAVASGEVVLEWDQAKGPKPKDCKMVKDVFASERRKAKTLNFSIAYGKTVHGLAADWGITTEEAEATLNAWYSDRPEVREWQEKTRAMAKKEGFVRTMMGRCRHLPDASGRGAPAAHALRAAINTPIQGSAADIVMLAMIKISKSEELRALGWRLLLQIHDEVILEGPKVSASQAMLAVRDCMENPFDGYGMKPLRVHLDVDMKSADSWYKAK